MSLTKIIPSIAAAIVAAAALTSPAAAGTYEVLSCSQASGTNLSWTFETNYPAGIRSTDRCSSADEDDADVFNTFAYALGIRTAFGAGFMPAGTYGYLRFDVPDGLAITGWRSGFKSHNGDENWNTVLQASAELLYDGAGGPSTPGPAAVQSLQPFASSQWLRVGFRCTAAPCSPGGSSHSVATRLYGAAVQVTDAAAPSVSLSDALTGMATVTASDQTGIKHLELAVDGAIVGASDRPCDYRKVLPCTSPGGQVSAAFAMPALAPGPHTIQARATDAAGNVGTSTQAVVIQPPPGTPTPSPSTPSPTPSPRPGLPAAQLKLRSVKRTGSQVRLRGQVARGCRSRLTVRVTAKGRTRTARLTAPKSGRWGTVIKGVKRGGKLTVKVTAAQSSACRAATARR